MTNISGHYQAFWRWWDKQILQTTQKLLNHVKNEPYGAFGLYLFPPELSAPQFDNIGYSVQLKEADSEQSACFPIVVGRVFALPFESESLSLVVVAVAIETSEAPHHLLKETARVLKPGGKLILVYASAWAPSRVCYWMPGAQLLGKPVNKIFSHHRVHDWLVFLGLEEEITYGASFFRAQPFPFRGIGVSMADMVMRVAVKKVPGGMLGTAQVRKKSIDVLSGSGVRCKEIINEKRP